MWITEQGGKLMVGGMGLKGLKQGPEDVLSAVCSWSSDMLISLGLIKGHLFLLLLVMLSGKETMCYIFMHLLMLIKATVINI